MAGTAVLAPGARAQTPGTSAPVRETPPQAQPAPIYLTHPTLVDTAHLKYDDTTLTVFGIKGWGGDPLHGLQSFLAENGDRLTCQPHAGSSYICKLTTGIDLAQAALANGAAQAADDAPSAYRQQEKAAQSEHLGIWAALPPAPVTIDRPVFQTTAVIEGDGQVVVLDGLIGFAARFYTVQLQNYVGNHGNRLICQQQPANGRYVCLLPDGTDIAAVALTNGLARVTADATAQYRAYQAKAVASKIGFWFNPPAEEGAGSGTVVSQQSECCGLPPGDLGAGIVYANGVPTAVIDNEPVFFGFAGLLGFGFFDLHRNWHKAPAPYLAHLDRFHPEGAGLRYPSASVAARSPTAFHAPAFASAAGSTAPLVFNGPGAMATTLPFHAPRAFTRSATVEPPGGFTPRGIGLQGGSISANPGFVPFRMPHAGVSEFHPGIIAAPHYASPGFIGRR